MRFEMGVQGSAAFLFGHSRLHFAVQDVHQHPVRVRGLCGRIAFGVDGVQNGFRLVQHPADAEQTLPKRLGTVKLAVRRDGDLRTQDVAVGIGGDIAVCGRYTVYGGLYRK